MIAKMITKRWLWMHWRLGRWAVASFVVLAVVARLSLPAVSRKVVASKASEGPHTRVDVDSVELLLWNGRVGSRDVAAYPPVEAAATDRPLIGWESLEAEMIYWALAHKLV